MSGAVIRGEGLNSNGGGFASLHVNGAHLSADEVARRVECFGDLFYALEGLARLMLPIDMTLAQAEICDEPMPDRAVILSFMGSGASDQVTAGEYRAAIAAVTAAIAKARGEA